MAASLFATGASAMALPATTMEDVCTCPAGYAIVVDVWLSNRTGAVLTVRVAVRRGGATLADSQYLLYDCPVSANGYERVCELPLDQGDVVSVYASDVGISMNVFVKDKRNVLSQ